MPVRYPSGSARGCALICNRSKSAYFLDGSPNSLVFTLCPMLRFGRFSVEIFSPVAAKRRFQLVLIKPSHYDGDGYVIRWWRAMIPSNSLAAVYGIAADCAERQVLGSDVTIDIEVIDETNTRIDVPKLLARFRCHREFGCIALIGVQSNQYPRALDIARPFRVAGIPVAMGGFHVSGCLSMLDGHAIDLDACREIGVAMFAGEAEGRLDVLLRDAAAGQLLPIYNFMKDLPGLEGTPVPFLPKHYITRTLGLSASFDAGRGCPYQCSFCTIINVQGRKSRYRSADDVEHLIRLNWTQGIHKFFITDDNFARNREWEAIFDRLIDLRENHGIPLGLLNSSRHALPQNPEFRGQSEARGRHAGLYWIGERQPGQSGGSEEAPKQDHRVSQDAACLENPWHNDARRVHSGISSRYVRDHQARYRDCSEGATA